MIRLTRYARFTSPSLDPMTMPRRERIFWNAVLQDILEDENKKSGTTMPEDL